MRDGDKAALMARTSPPIFSDDLPSRIAWVILVKALREALT